LGTAYTEPLRTDIGTLATVTVEVEKVATVMGKEEKMIG
jgi:hypothetical protein